MMPQLRMVSAILLQKHHNQRYWYRSHPLLQMVSLNLSSMLVFCYQRYHSFLLRRKRSYHQHHHTMFEIPNLVSRLGFCRSRHPTKLAFVKMNRPKQESVHRQPKLVCGLQRSCQGALSHQDQIEWGMDRPARTRTANTLQSCPSFD